jgi:hypothetical protein
MNSLNVKQRLEFALRGVEQLRTLAVSAATRDGGRDIIELDS